MAEHEGWNQKKIMHYFNNMQAFEKFYSNVSSAPLFGMNNVLGDSDPSVSMMYDLVAKKAARH